MRELMGLAAFVVVGAVACEDATTTATGGTTSSSNSSSASSTSSSGTGGSGATGAGGEGAGASVGVGGTGGAGGAALFAVANSPQRIRQFWLTAKANKPAEPADKDAKAEGKSDDAKDK